MTAPDAPDFADEAVAQPAAEVVQAGRRRSSRIESVRAVAALAVLGSHVFAYAHGWRPVIFEGYLHRAIMGGGFGVQLFFGLSGFLIYRPFARRDFGDGARITFSTYFKNRALRLLPLYYVAVVVLLVLTQHGGSFEQWWRFGLFAEGFSTHTAQTVDAPMWSLIVELHFYILLPLIALLVAKLSRRSPERGIAVLVALAVPSLVIRQLDLAPAVLWQYSFAATFFGFVPGMALAVLQTAWKDRLPSMIRGWWARSDVWLLTGGAVWAVVCWRYSLIPLLAVGSFLVVGACVLPLKTSTLVRGLDWRPLALVGVASYSLYLWHVPIIEQLVRHPIPGGSWGLLVLATGLSLAAAAISYMYVERPVLMLRGTWASTTGTGGGAEQTDRHGPVFSDRAVVGASVIIAFLVRLAAIGLTHPLKLQSDAADYDRLGRLIAGGHWFGTSLLSPSGGPTAFRPPLYPLFVGAVYRVTGDSITSARIVQAVLGAGAVALIVLIAWRLFGRRVALVAGGLSAIYPALVLSSVALLSESVFVPLELGAIAAALEARRAVGRSVVLWSGLCGACAALGVLARPNSVVMLPLLAVLLLPKGWRADVRRHLVAPLALAVAAAVVVAPWEIRNVVVMHSAVPVSDIDAFNLAGVYNDQTAHESIRTRYQFRPPSGVPEFAPYFKDRSLDELGVSAKLRSAALTYLRHHPTAPVEAAALNSLRMLEVTGQQVSDLSGAESGYGHRAAVVARLAFWAMALLAVAGVVVGRRRRPPWALLLIPVALWLITVPFLGAPRLRVPIEPFLVLGAAVAVDAALSRLARARR